MSDPRDGQIAVQAFKRLQEILNHPSLAPVLVGNDSFPPAAWVWTDEQIGDFVKVAANPLFQAAGTARMGRRGDPAAVLDAKARVYGVRKLRVVDASSLPILTTKPCASHNL